MFRSTEGGIWGLEIWAGFGCLDMLEKVLDLACLYVLRNGQKRATFGLRIGQIGSKWLIL